MGKNVQILKGKPILIYLGSLLVLIGLFITDFSLNIYRLVILLIITLSTILILYLFLSKQTIILNDYNKKEFINSERNKYHKIFNNKYLINIGFIIYENIFNKNNKLNINILKNIIIKKRENKLVNLVFSKTINPHVIIFGESGSGKTSLSKVIACHDQKLKTIVIDFHGEYYEDLVKCGFCYFNAAERIPNPFDTYGQRIQIRAIQLSFLFTRLFGFGRLQRSLLAELILEFYKTRMKKDSDTPRTPTLMEFMEFLDQKKSEITDSDEKKRIASIRSSLSILSDFVDKSGNIPLDKCEKIVVDLNELSIDSLQEFVAEVIINDIYQAAKVDANDYLIVIDEAHRLLYSDKSSDIIRQITQEGRKYGVFLVLVTQNPIGLDPRILNNISTRITFRMSEKKNLDYVVKLLVDDFATRENIARLAKIVSRLDTGMGVLRGLRKNSLIVFKTLDSSLGAKSERG